MPIDFHTGASQGFKILPAVDFAIENNFDGVQIYINEEILEPSVRHALVTKLNESNLTNVVFHLPDYNNLTEELVNALNSIVDELSPQIRWEALIHFGYNDNGNTLVLSITEIPKIGGKRVSIENSKTGVFDPEHVKRAMSFARMLNTGFVFDIGRILYPNSKGIVDPQETYNFITRTINLLDPAKDIIHVAGKSAWELKFREAPAVFGSPEDITTPTIEILREFEKRGGIVVFEHEDRDMILKSRENLLTEH